LPTIVEDKRDDGATNASTEGSSKEESSSKEKEVVHA
jgi:hypothetical protein